MNRKDLSVKMNLGVESSSSEITAWVASHAAMLCDVGLSCGVDDRGLSTNVLCRDANNNVTQEFRRKVLETNSAHVLENTKDTQSGTQH